MATKIGKSSLALYRDCLRLIEHMAGRSAKAQTIKGILRGEFAKNRNETDPVKIEELRGSVMQGLANYLTVESLSRLKRKGPDMSKLKPMELNPAVSDSRLDDLRIREAEVVEVQPLAGGEAAKKS